MNHAHMETQGACTGGYLKVNIETISAMKEGLTQTCSNFIAGWTERFCTRPHVAAQHKSDYPQDLCSWRCHSGKGHLAHAATTAAARCFLLGAGSKVGLCSKHGPSYMGGASFLSLNPPFSLFDCLLVGWLACLFVLCLPCSFFPGKPNKTLMGAPEK